MSSPNTRRSVVRRVWSAAAVSLSLIAAAATHTGAQRPSGPDLVAQATAALAQYSGTIVVRGLHEPVEVLRDKWGIPHIYAKSTEDLFFAQGFVVAQDRMWQIEMWRRNGEGRLSEVLGPQYVTRDKFARLLAFRGNWDEEFKKYHPEGRKIFEAFAAGVNACIQNAIAERKVPVEFGILGFQPQPVWTAETVLTRMPGWTLSRNAAREVRRGLQVRELGAAKVEELSPTEPEKKLVVPAGLDLNDLSPEILDITRGANNIRWTLGTARASGPQLEQMIGGMGSNNWVVDGSKSTTGAPIVANDPHREVVNPALRYVVHLVAPGWNALGATEPGLPGITIGHNERIAWGFTILGMDQQDLYVEETDPQNPDRYLYKGQWETMKVERQLIHVKGGPTQEFTAKFTRHGPVLYEDTVRHRAFALRWVGAEPGGAGYLGSLHVMQAENWQEFKAAVAKAWYIPSHSLVYADVDGHIGYVGVARTPIRKNWDGLLPVPGKDGQYEWAGYVPYDQLPQSFDTPKHFYNSSNNDVVPKIVPGYSIPLGYEYSAPYRYNRVAEVLSENRKFSVADMETLQHDVVSLPARQLVPLLKRVRPATPESQRAVDMLLGWNLAIDRDSAAAALYEFWLLKMMPMAYAPHVPSGVDFTQYNIQQVIRWMTRPDAAYGATGGARTAARDKILLDALDQAVAELKGRLGDDMTKWKWGDLHTADFVHPLATTDALKSLFHIDPVRRGGDGYTVMATSNPSATRTTQVSGASFQFVFDVKNWDASKGLSVPGNSDQPRSPHYADLVPYWGKGEYFPLVFSRAEVEANATDRLTLQPLREPDAEATAGEPAFEPVQPDLFEASGAQTNPWADFDNDGRPDLFVGFRRGHLNRLYHNEGGGRFTDVAVEVGLADAEDTRAAAWGDFDGDGWMDLYVGFARMTGTPNKLYRNDGDGRHFTEVGHQWGVGLVGESRQISWIDYDNDGRVDLFVAFRDHPNVLFHNEGDHFRDVSKEMGVADPRKTVGATWFDMDQDGRLDLFVANQDGDNNGFFRNEGTRFVDVAHELGMDGAGRPAVFGGVGPSVADYDGDGLLDLFVANYGPNELFHNEGQGRFRDVAPEMGVAGEYHGVSSAWGDFDNDGRPDLYVTAYINGITRYPDFLYRNDGDHFTDVTPATILRHDGDHGVQWADFDQDGALDLALANNEPVMGTHYLYRNLLSPDRARRALEVLVLDEKGHYTRAGSEIRLYAAGTRTIVGSGMVDTGSGYCSQSALPVHFGLGRHQGPVDVEVTYLTQAGRRTARVANVDPAAYAGKYLVVKVGPTASQP